MPQPNTNKTLDQQISEIFQRHGFYSTPIGMTTELKTLIAEARKEEHAILQHQAFNVLKTAKAVGEWSEMRVEDIEDKSDE